MARLADTCHRHGKWERRRQIDADRDPRIRWIRSQSERDRRPGFSGKQKSEIETVADTIHVEINVVGDPDDLPQRMFRADFAVTTASTTTCELFALETPTICLLIIKR